MSADEKCSCAVMPGAENTCDSVPPGTARFALTHWSVIIAAGRMDSADTREALEKLCRTYWLPIYAFVRRQGHSPHDSQDLTQGFFERLLGKNALSEVDRSKGRFRSFLLSSLKNFLANEWDKATAQKRGGGQVLISINSDEAERIGEFEPVDNFSAEDLFERRWALALLEQVLHELRHDYATDGRKSLFEALKGTLTEVSQSVPYAEIALRLGTSEGAIKVAVYRLRQRYRELLRAEIARTVTDESEVDDEIRNLFSALAR
jgi:RNA polymerase sigma factor (sigma-70 family)